MSFDTSGALLEGIRVSSGNNPFTFPPRTLVTNPVQFNSTSSRAEYGILVDSSDPTVFSAEIADPSLIFRWTRNESSVVRFNYDGYGRRWLPSPGSSPDSLGMISNTSRLVIPVPNLAVTSAPVSIYLNGPPRINFLLQLVPSTSNFTDPAPGTVQVSSADGKLNFSSVDLNTFAGQTVLSTRQSFFDRTKSKGVIGQFPLATTLEYSLYLNPRPAAGQYPRVRIGYGRYLIPNQVPNEASLGSPPVGVFNWSADTGRVQFSQSDFSSNLGASIYYDGVTIGSFSLPRTSVGSIIDAFPISAFTIASFIGATDPNRFIVFAEATGQSRYYLTTSIIESASSFPTSPPDPGSVYLDTTTGFVYLNSSDISRLVGYNFSYLDTVAFIENGVSVQFFRSGVNGSGVSQEPDFSIIYEVSDQVIQDSIGPTPFSMLPTTPVQDSSLSFKVSLGSGSTGTFTGDLVDGRNSASLGIGYLLDLDSHQFKFSNRKTVSITLDKATPSVKLQDPAISPIGFQITRNGTPIVEDLDFHFDSTSGLLDFVQSVGEDDKNNFLNISGSTQLPNIINASSSIFSFEKVGQSVFIPSGPNAGLYTISKFLSTQQVELTPDLIAAQPEVFDLRAKFEVIADRFWTSFLPPFKKFSISVASSPSSVYSALSNSQFSVFANTSQVNLVTPAQPGQSFQVTYIWLQSSDNDVTSTPTTVTEKALFKVRQENATVTSGQTTVTFNSSNHTINTARAIEVFVDGITQSDFQYVAPNKIILNGPATTESVVVNYWVEDALGGETSFNLLNSPIDVDFPQITEGQSTTVFNGDQTSIISDGSAILVNGTDVLIVSSATYNPAVDVTNVTFESSPSISSSGQPLQSTQSITGSYRVSESNYVDVFARGTNVVSITGNCSYIPGMVLTVDGDPYLVLSAKYGVSFNKTRVTVASSAIQNYIIPSVTRTVRPILFPNSSFNTSLSAHLGFPFTLVRMGSTRSVLRPGVDYSVQDGGTVSLAFQAVYGDSITALYVARSAQPVGTKLDLNYANVIAPAAFGLVGQQLSSSYHLYAPDSFFYRVETYVSFLPEVVDLLKQNAQSGGVSGPSISNSKSMKTKDFGSSSLYFDEQHYGNLDAEVRRLLKFYNDLINQYEDLLSNLDGRVAGGTSGKFRFDGNTSNPPRLNYSSVTNDIDDFIQIYSTITLTGFFSFSEVPVYSRMSDPSNFSRLFPTSQVATAAIGSNVGPDAFGQPIGSLGVKNLTSVGQFTSSPSNSIFSSVLGGTEFTIPNNGDTSLLVPQFKPGQSVRIYKLDGTPDIIGTVSSVSTTAPFVVVLDMATTLLSGSLLRDSSDSGLTINHFYTPGRDIGVDNDSGQITNNTFDGALHALQANVVGSELIDSDVTFSNASTTPKRVPALDGKELTDDGHLSAPQLKYTNELDLLSKELASLNFIAEGVLQPDLITILNPTFIPAVNDQILILSGHNAGQSRTVISILTNSFVVDVAFPFVSTGTSQYTLVTDSEPITTIVQNELKVIGTNVAKPHVDPALIGTVDCESISMTNAILGLGFIFVSGASGQVSGPNTFTGIPGILSTDYLLIDSGPNMGLYDVVSVSGSTVIISTTAPYYVFPATGQVLYTVIRPWPFVSAKEFDTLAPFYLNTIQFFRSTQTWANSVTRAGTAARAVAINNRKSAISKFITQLSGLLGKDDKLYDSRWLWIQERTDRKTGTLVQQTQAASQRADNLQKLLENQQKLLMAQTLV